MSNYNYRKTTLIIKIVVHQHPLNPQILNLPIPNHKETLAEQGYVKKKGCNCNKNK